MGDWNYTNLWRTNYEAREVGAWGASMLASTGVQVLTGMPMMPYLITMGVQAGFALSALPRAVRVYRAKKSLLGSPLSFTSIGDIAKIVEKHPDSFYYGQAFQWRQQHGQHAFELQSRDMSAVLGKKGLRDPNVKGSRWIHGLGMVEEEECLRPAGMRDIHTLVTGTTGAGKTRLFDLAITQCILRGEAVIIIDPKGDKGLAETCRRTCALMNKPNRFRYFHPAFPDESIRLSLTRNYGRATELASRVAVLMASESGDPFQAFAMMALNNVIQAMLIIGELPSLLSLRRTLEGDIPGLTIRVLTAYGRMVRGEKVFDAAVEQACATAKVKNPEDKAKALRKLYYADLIHDAPNSDLEGLLTMLEHERAHFSKMIAGLLPILVMLTAGRMSDLLSPAHTVDGTDAYQDFSDMNTVINGKQVLYMGLDSLSDPMVGSALGSLALADLASTAGEIYNHRLPVPVNIFVDEAAEVINDQLIQLLNKGRGAGINLFIATQTIADFKARMGDESKAMQVLANANNIISLRVLDTDTQEFIAKKLPMTRYKYVMRTQGNSAGEGGVITGGNQGERLMEEEGELFPSALLGNLPDLEYLAIFAGGDVRKGRLPILNFQSK
ncbi:conjugal transfer protein [Stutzerimonas xanthomarina]|jgi:conjugal transfer pilus assembly protein TraD|uniref:Conjugative transfer system coupling protein TraD n=2 Tax=Stutzerimonas TaxID=2901164 RepID=A0A165T0P2_STUST|nr:MULTISPECIES: conjugative transfer system coupling protein TraD [Stutzerimonas]WAD28968.1 conjugative transfer system coupling protein TraD [Pseudomonadaceae bacterium T75]KZX56681.1 conjugal transfer protein [Stutzerimonas frequens]MBH3355796.1 conjugative transfer system coupling protein TraD [Stutzerimonas stutzeri]MDH0084100.1 conjugative transfer system coupling protein TraD [Stutzerimonas stutzeri]QGZ32982.1 conjugative transfer system coupling protein TraD [Stutzerimonas stutzeri]